MTDRDSKQAEKDYLRRSGGGQWESSKPFPPLGQVADDEHAQHILDFAVLLQVLAPRSSDRILDLGAGSGWVSDWMKRCGFHTVGLDISVDMLRLAAQRLPATGLVAGDMEHLPFATGAFDKACCLNAFHHVPNVEIALKEVRRVLKSNGVVFFSEPGRGHASNPTSLAATRNYGVQESEILIQPFMDACRRAGFADVRLHPISNIMPLFHLDAEQWVQWTTFTSSVRPARALEKLFRAVLELFGRRKDDLLFEEAFAIRLLRELQPVIEQHPIVTAYCQPYVKPTRSTDAARLGLLTTPTAVLPGALIVVPLRIANTGSTAWNSSRPDEVRLGAQLMAHDGELLERDFSRHELPEVLPGTTFESSIELTAPPTAGAYLIKLDLVREGAHWFELSGTTPVQFRIDVRG